MSSASAPGVSVCCVKWGTKYPAVYANRLRRMVERYLSVPHDFVCLTEDPTGLDPDIRTIPLPDDYRGYWNKISLFRSDLFEPRRTMLYLDVDIVIVGSLDPLLQGDAALTIARGFSKNYVVNSSVMRFKAGTLTHVYDRFAEDPERIVASGRYATDQNWIHEQVPDAAFFPPGSIVSYKKDMPSHVFPLAKKLSLGLGWLKAPSWMTVSPPPGASIVVFHGKPDPEDVMDAPYGPWKRAPFIKEFWR